MKHWIRNTLLLALCTAPVTAAEPYPSGVDFSCAWEFISGPRQGQQGTSAIRFTLTGSPTARSGDLVTTGTGPGANWRIDDTVHLTNPRWSGTEKLWDLQILPKDIRCTLRTLGDRVIFESCSNGAQQTCMRAGSSTSSTAPRRPYVVLKGIYLKEDHEDFSKPEIEAFIARAKPCDRLVCYETAQQTNLIFDGQRRSDALVRSSIFPDINKKHRWYNMNVVLSPWNDTLLGLGLVLVEDDKDKGKLFLNDCRDVSVGVTCGVGVGGGDGVNFSSCPRPTFDGGLKILSCLLGKGDDLFDRVAMLSGNIDHNLPITTLDVGEWKVRLKLEYF